MSLENHVPSLELCNKWKSCGGRQDTLFHYVKTISLKYKLVTEEDLKGYRTMRRVGEYFAAPLASEMMEWLKSEIDEISHSVDRWRVIPFDYDSFKDKSLPNALMQMAIELESK